MISDKELFTNDFSGGLDGAAGGAVQSDGRLDSSFFSAHTLVGTTPSDMIAVMVAMMHLSEAQEVISFSAEQ